MEWIIVEDRLPDDHGLLVEVVRCEQCQYYNKRCTGLIKLDTGAYWTAGGCLNGERREATNG